MDNNAEVFGARVQYGDWQGVAQADDGDFVSIRKEMIRRDLLEDDNFVIGVQTFNGENLEMGLVAPMSVTALVIKAQITRPRSATFKKRIR